MFGGAKYLGVILLALGIILLSTGNLGLFSLFEESTPYSDGWVIGRDQSDITDTIPMKDLGFLNAEQQVIMKKLSQQYNSQTAQSLTEEEGKNVLGRPKPNTPSSGMIGILGINETIINIYSGTVGKYKTFITGQKIGQTTH